MCTMDLDTAAMAAATRAPTGIVAEAGSREAPALPPGLLTEVVEAKSYNDRPTKLFIGGISRHTTTKQLRDHFSAFGRVLDCVAMRQPDGRPRGFGYVTLDSPEAGQRCLAEPQMIDNRIVDMKLAVPEGSSSGGTSPKEAGFNMKMFPGQADYHMGMLAHGFNGWPEAAGGYNSWWGGSKPASPTHGLDCADLLTAARELAVSHGPQSHGFLLQQPGLHEYGDYEGLYPGDEPQSTLIPDEFQQPAGASGKMSASAPEFVPNPLAPEFVPMATKTSAKADTKTSAKAMAVTPQAQKASRARPPLGELTNIVEVEDLLKPFKSPSNKLADMGHGHLSGMSESPDGAAGPRTGLLLGDEADESSPSSSSADNMNSASTSPDSLAKEEPAKKETVDNVEDQCEDLQDDKGPVSPVDTDDSDDGSSFEGDPIVVDMDALPSMGSAQHATGECKRCNFYPKGRCQNGKNCTFCHFSHDKRKPSRQEKRERRAAWLDGQDPEDGQPMVHGQPMVVHPTGPFLSKHALQQQGCFPMGAIYPDEDFYNDETLAYSMFPGMPPICATKLPAPLPLPGMDTSSWAGPQLPPGLAPPAARAAQPWQPEAEASPAANMLLSTSNFQPVFSTGRTSSFLSTVPTPLRTPASTPASTPMATPTAAMTATSVEARSMMSVSTATSTSGTQTGADWKCKKCEEELEADSDSEGQQWSREELLRLRDGLTKMKESETPSGIHQFRTMAITACPSV